MKALLSWRRNEVRCPFFQLPVSELSSCNLIASEFSDLYLASSKMGNLNCCCGGVPKEEKQRTLPERRQQAVAEEAVGAQEEGVPVEEKMWAFPVRRHLAAGEFPVVSGTMENENSIVSRGGDTTTSKELSD
ncbi:uncharacterized protein LOC144613874 isoform X2 [Panthera onca]